MKRILLSLFALAWTPTLFASERIRLSEADEIALLDAVHRSFPQAAEQSRHEQIHSFRQDDGRITGSVIYEPVTTGRRSRALVAICRRADADDPWSCDSRGCGVHYQEKLTVAGQDEPVFVSAETDEAFVDTALAYVHRLAMERREGLTPSSVDRFVSVTRAPMGTDAQIMADNRAGQFVMLYMMVAPRLTEEQLASQLVVYQPGAVFSFQLDKDDIPRGPDGQHLVNSQAIAVPADRFLLLRTRGGTHALRRIADDERDSANGAVLELYRLGEDGSVLEHLVREVAQNRQDSESRVLHLGDVRVGIGDGRWVRAPVVGDNLVAAYTSDTPENGFLLDDAGLRWYYLYVRWDRLLAAAGDDYEFRLRSVDTMTMP